METTENASAQSTSHLRRRLTALLLAVVGLAALLLANPGVANATASTQAFYAECSPATVQAYAPDMGWYPNYGVAWAPTLYVWTSSGWQKYVNGPTQTARGTNIGTWTGDWIQQQVTFSGLARGHYYQVRVTGGWFGQGSGNRVFVQVPVPHQTAQGNFTFAAYSNSTSSYCYIP